MQVVLIGLGKMGGNMVERPTLGGDQALAMTVVRWSLPTRRRKRHDGHFVGRGGRCQVRALPAQRFGGHAVKND